MVTILITKTVSVLHKKFWTRLTKMHIYLYKYILTATLHIGFKNTRG